MKHLTVCWTPSHTMMDYHDDDPPVMSELTLDEMMERVRRAVMEGYKVDLRFWLKRR